MTSAARLRRTARKARYLVPAAAIVLLSAFQVRAYWGTGWRPNPIKEGLPQAETGVVDRGFTFCRLLYQSVTSEQRGHGWNTDYPGSDHNFVTRLAELTTTKPSRWADDGDPGYAVVRATQDELYECPFLFMSDVGTVGFSEAEVSRLRAYFAKGGFLWVDDFWGERAWARWSGEIHRVLPDYPIIDIGPEHMIMHALYEVDEVPQIPSIQFWRQSGRRATSEMGSNSAVPHLRGIFDPSGRPLVLMSHNTDIADGWEREGEDDDFFYAFSPEAYALGVNVVLYSLTH